MDEPLELTPDDRGVLKVSVTVAFAEKYGLSYRTAAEYFESKRIYDYLDLHSGILVTKMYPFVAALIAEQYGVPTSDQTTS